MDTNNLIVWLPFNNSPTEDLCGNTWTASGNPTIGTNGAISGKALQLDGASQIQLNKTFSLGGKDFTLNWLVTMNPSLTTGWNTLFEATTSKYSAHRIEITRYDTSTNTLRIYAKEMWGFYQDINIPVNTKFHLELDYSHAESKLRIFVDGVLAATVIKSLAAKNIVAFTLGWGTSCTNYFTGTIDEFQIYDGVALHTANFTPPTADYYLLPKINFKPEVFMSWIPTGEINFKPELFASIIDDSTKVEFTADLSCNVTKTETFAVDLQRKVTRSEVSAADLQRSVMKTETFAVDLQRNIVKSVDMRVDLQRKLSNFVEFNADLQRSLANVVKFTVDLQRTFVGNTTFTVDLQARILWRWLTRILPESSFLDSKMLASAEALDAEITKFHLAIREVLHLPRLDELSGTILDLLAEQFHVDYYDAINFSDEEKRNLIRQSIAWHRIKGTPAAVEMVLQDAFKDLRIDEWFTYGGEPYFFRIWCRGYKSTPERFKSFWLMFMDAKNVRSHLEQVTIDISPEEPIKIYTGVAHAVSGLKTVGLPRPKDKFIQLYTGVVRIKSGQKNIGLPKRDRVSKAAVVTGIVVIRNGTVFSGMKYDPLPPDDDFAFSDGDWLRLYFNYPTGRDHPVLLKNPREDLINGDIKEVGDYAVQNVIFTNQFAEGTLGINRAALIKGFEVTPKSDDKLLPNTGELRLFFGFPSGNKHKILLHNRRKDIYLKEIREFGLETAKNNLLVNAYNEKTSGITHVALIRNFVINDQNYYQKVTFEEE